MAKIKVKVGEIEVEVDSRDFYVDNGSINDVIEALTKSITQNLEKITALKESPQEPKIDALGSIDDAEIHEPEFTDPIPIDITEIKSKLLVLHKNSFFNKPRTVTETVEQLREYGWRANPFDVSRTLANMAANREIYKDCQENKSYYIKEPIIVT
ncbi:MAG: hypothetical protein GWN01_07845 [Nitrosopumilaceae archaeon]|nr:hypothetical protein [Nitrosopumilaceae archaeon]NIU00832.1 hypothetical protein [Nitrosopumilaceae archaeon]NIU87285.1 hypothetical protein [Nitrosopumilaceae archaeon]NIV65813.1 hypothetical protein [Nitrosopumilaceae archaeon]NIX61434.1 hypothetical protein [Nitrosopumilaceae archaeon]